MVLLLMNKFIKVKNGLVKRLWPTKEAHASSAVPVYGCLEESTRWVRTSEEVRKSRIYANVPLGMD